MARYRNPRTRSQPAAAVPPRTERDWNRRLLSQNFLRDSAVAARFADAAQVEHCGLVLEVGAGNGAVTRELARRCGSVIAYELDAVLARELAAQFADRGNVRCVPGDFLAARPPGEPFAVVGNIPFSITSKIVDWCLAAPRLTSATMITQWEYARKRSGDYGRWSLVTVLSWPEFHWQLGARISRTRFRPVPRVDAGVLRLQRRARPLIPPAGFDGYRRLVSLGFSGVGGSVQASLRRRYPAGAVRQAFRAARLDPESVVAAVHPDQWIQLFTALS